MLKYTFWGLIWVLLMSCDRPDPTTSADSINAVVGNTSFVEQFGYAPTASTDEVTRIQTHLAYAERTLRQRFPANLTPAQRTRRQHLLNLLRDYRQAGLFPRNFDYPNERRPCFIDRDGRLCAVGYLVAETAGRAVAEKINEQHQYDYVRNIHTPELLIWATSAGLTPEECALIQPTYGWLPSPNPNPSPSPSNALSTGYGVSTAVWGGLNVALSAVNTSQIGQTNAGSAVAWAGIVSGGGQVLLGSLRMPKETSSGSGPTINQPEKTASLLNIGIGTTTIALSAWNLFSHRRQPTPRTSFSVSSPVRDGLAVSITRQF